MPFERVESASPRLNARFLTILNVGLFADSDFVNSDFDRTPYKEGFSY